MTSAKPSLSASDQRDRELLIVRFQRNMALVCIGAIPVFIFIFTRV
jgi:hypothetical protein